MIMAEFEFYGYTAPTNGTWMHDGTIYTYDKDFRTVARYKEYLATGMNILLLQHENEYDGEKWETSATKKCMDNAYKAGIKKIIVGDKRLKALCGENADLIGENSMFVSEKALEEHISQLIAPYREHPAFFGIQLKDEPRYYNLRAYGRVYKALKKAVPGIFLQCNLFPMGDSLERFSPDKTDPMEAFKEYLEKFLDETAGDSLCFDEYPFRRDGITHDYCLRSLQLAARICKERGVRLCMVIQTFGMLNKRGQITFRNCAENDVYWQLNLMAGLGVRNIGYFTYFTKQMSVSDGEKFLDGSSFINHDGTKTRLYYSVKKIHKEFQSFAKIIYDFKYNGMRVVSAEKKNRLPPYLDKVEKDPFLALVSICAVKGNLVVTESVKGKSVLYMVQNITDPFYKLKASAEVVFSTGYAVEKYYNGVLKEEFEGSVNHKILLAPGRAVFFRLRKSEKK